MPVVCGKSYEVTDPFFSNVALLLHGNGPNASASFTDYSSKSRIIAPSFGATISTAQSKFNGSAMAFSGGNGARIDVPASTDFALAARNFTFETWLYKTANNANGARLWNSAGGDAFDGLSFSLGTTGGFSVNASSNGTAWNLVSIDSIAALALNTWHHLAVVRNGGSLLAFVNGTLFTLLTTLGTTALYNNTLGHVIGSQAASPYRSLTGYLAEYRITLDVARYTAAFTVPATPFPNN